MEGGQGEAQTKSVSWDYDQVLPDGSVLYRNLKTDASIDAKHPLKPCQLFYESAKKFHGTAGREPEKRIHVS